MTEIHALLIQALVAGVVGLGQCGLIAWGIWIMRASNTSREAQTEMMQAQTQALERQGQALERMGAGIERLLERST